MKLKILINIKYTSYIRFGGNFRDQKSVHVIVNNTFKKALISINENMKKVMNDNFLVRLNFPGKALKNSTNFIFHL